MTARKRESREIIRLCRIGKAGSAESGYDGEESFADEVGMCERQDGLYGNLFVLRGVMFAAQVTVETIMKGWRQ